MVEQAACEPILSVTIAPTGSCARQVEREARSLARSVGSADPIYPHITLQAIYNPVDLKALEVALADLSSRVYPFDLTLGGVGLLRSTSDPSRLHLHLQVEKTPRLTALYTDVRRIIAAEGGVTYPYTAESWHPHLTLVYGHFPEEVLRGKVAELDKSLVSCSFVVDGLGLNRRSPDGEWLEMRFFPLRDKPPRSTGEDPDQMVAKLGEPGDGDQEAHQR